MSERVHELITLPVPAGGALRGDFFSTAGRPSEFALLFVHGFGSLRRGEKAGAFEEACARRGWAFAAFDFRGHGDSTGTLFDLRCRTLMEDLDAVVAFLEGRGIRHVFPVGSSMGGWAVCWMALRHAGRIPACVLLAPAFHFPQGIWDRLDERQQRAWKETGRFHLKNDWIDADVAYALIAEAFSLEDMIRRWEKPLLIFHGMKDDTVPFERSVRVAAQLPASVPVEVRLFNDGDHRLVAHKHAIAEAAGAFFTRWCAECD
jgi:pimeloyl-ACP methyl ester carboxylesterase